MEDKVLISLDRYEEMKEAVDVIDALTENVNIEETRSIERGFEPYKIVSVRKKDLIQFFEKISGTNAKYDNIEII